MTGAAAKKGAMGGALGAKPKKFAPMVPRKSAMTAKIDAILAECNNDVSQL